jgi:predicted CoA-binding protein
MTDPQDAVIERVLARTRTIAVVGASRDPEKSAHGVPAMLQGEGYRIIPVNPHADTLFGERVHRTLGSIDEPIDLVDVFRPSRDAAAVVRDAIAVGARAVWLQLGIESDEARRLATDAGIDYVEDRCLAVEVRLRGATPPSPTDSPASTNPTSTTW